MLSETKVLADHHAAHCARAAPPPRVQAHRKEITINVSARLGHVRYALAELSNIGFLNGLKVKGMQTQCSATHSATRATS